MVGPIKSPLHPPGLLSDDQCKARDARRKARIGAQPPKPAPEEEKPVKQGPDIRHATPPPEDIMENLPETDKQLIERLVFYQEKYELPEPHDVKMMEVGVMIHCGLIVTQSIFSDILTIDNP